jgi:hypothetical protein
MEVALKVMTVSIQKASGGNDLSAVQNLAACADDHLFHGDIDTGPFHPFFDNHGKTATAWHFHDDSCNAFDTGLFKDLGKFLDVILSIIQLGATHQHGFALNEITVHGGKCHRDAIRQNQQVSTL